MASKEDAIEILKTIVDPELYIDIYTLGLIYDVSVEGRTLNIRMTFTSPACPAGQFLVEQVREKTMEHDEIDDTNVEVVFEPPWEPSEELKAMMGLS